MTSTYVGKCSRNFVGKQSKDKLSISFKSFFEQIIYRESECKNTNFGNEFRKVYMYHHTDIAKGR